MRATILSLHSPPGDETVISTFASACAALFNVFTLPPFCSSSNRSKHHARCVLSCSARNRLLFARVLTIARPAASSASAAAENSPRAAGTGGADI